MGLAGGSGTARSGPSPAALGRKGSRSRARKRALDILFESEARGDDPLEVLRGRVAGADAPPVSDFAISLVEGVVAHREEIDTTIASYAQGWTLDRMPAVDRTILRIGVLEILWSEDVPDPVAIDEAIDLAHALSTDDSPRFVNGVLAGVSSGQPRPVALPVPDRVDVPDDAELESTEVPDESEPAEGPV